MSRNKKALKDKYEDLVNQTIAEMDKTSEGDEGLKEEHDQVQQAYKSSEQQLREDLIRVAYNHPEIREDILPLVLDNKKQVKKHDEDEDEDEGKKLEVEVEVEIEATSKNADQLREDLIRVAYENPEIRMEILPLLEDK